MFHVVTAQSHPFLFRLLRSKHPSHDVFLILKKDAMVDETLLGRRLGYSKQDLDFAEQFLLQCNTDMLLDFLQFSNFSDYSAFCRDNNRPHSNFAYLAYSFLQEALPEHLNPPPRKS